ncbi:hypothetical protein MGYG_01348 [Nannizzia gypsea CBS 118893]|uniref:LYC1 C-terminal domain-containing protein n=1 Tax=Arthroderma gypseum (strain ATCC MYA-4604 / CBS 118893) TaxID=535722 RepID=E5R0B9_ARTGP|nr:hypothetical protein MGYG_01348 [Nannizzia gypsea CBS 118893]EFQ98315.1 hypothetical protein MGYG_01348 [Nannizzia gypsea CBS 118893]
MDSLPDALSPNLHLAHPTQNENLSIWRDTSEEWKAALTVSEYMNEYQYLTTVPLAKDGCMTQWILVDKTLPADQRTILASCETFRKCSLTQELDGSIKDTVTHGVASVYCEPKYRGRGYASRLMVELSRTLLTWQADGRECVASILFSDIGGDFYGKRGWYAFPSHHIRFEPAPMQLHSVKPIFNDDLGPLCKLDEHLVRKSMTAAPPGRLRHMVIPDLDHILWHGCREKFSCEKLFGKIPEFKGAIAGDPGNRVWVLWNHRFVGAPGDKNAANTLYILRLVVENHAVLQSLSTDPAQQLSLDEEQQLLVCHARDAIRSAQNEAAGWKLNSVEIWDPSAQVHALIQRTGVPYQEITRVDNEICCLNWLRKEEGKSATVEWAAIEKYCWC